MFRFDPFGFAHVDSNNIICLFFSLRWSGCLKNPTNDISDVTMNVRINNLDDYARVWANNRLVMSTFTNGNDRSFTITIARGQCYPLTIEYRNSGGLASMSIQWLQTSPAPAPGTDFQVIPVALIASPYCTAPQPPVCAGLRAVYYPDYPWTTVGIPAMDNQISFDWSSITPALPSNPFPLSSFSVVWEGYVTPTHISGDHQYLFSVAVKPGTMVSMTLNTDPVITDNVSVKALWLSPGNWYPIKITLTQDTNSDPYFGLFWTDLNIPGAIPTIVPAMQLRTTPDCSPAPPVIPPCSGLYSDFYRGQYLVGEPVSTTIETTSSISWAPAPNADVPADDFSVRFSACLRNPSLNGAYTQPITLYVTSSNKMRVWLGPDLKVETTGEFSLPVTLPAGRCTPFSIELLHNTGVADLKLEWSFVTPHSRTFNRRLVDIGSIQPSSCAVDNQRSCRGLVGNYYTGNQEFVGTPFTRIDSAIQFAWAGSDPILPGLATPEQFPSAYFSISWSGWLMPKHASGTETYRFSAYSDDRMSVWVNGANVVTDWGAGHGPARFSGDVVTLEANKPVPITIWHSQAGGVSVAGLSWEIVSKTDPELVPTRYLQRTRDCSPIVEPPACSGLYAEYYQSQWFQDLPFSAVAYSAMNLAWNAPLANPVAGQPPISSFAARFTGCVLNPSPSDAQQTVQVEFRIRSPNPTVTYFGSQQPMPYWDGATDRTWTVDLAPNTCTPISIDYRQNSVPGSLQLSWKYRLTTGLVEPGGPIPRQFLKPTRCSIDENRSCRGVRGEYFPDIQFMAGSFLARDNQLSFFYSDNRPPIDVPGFPANGYQVRFRTYIVPDVGGDYLFSIWVDDAVRLRINGVTVLDFFTETGFTRRGPSSPVNLKAGIAYLLELDYAGYSSSDAASVYWELPGQFPATIIPIFNTRQSPDCSGNTLAPALPACAGLYAEYFDNLNLFGQPIATARELDVSTKNWASGSVSSGAWAVRYSGCILSPRSDQTNPMSATLRFKATGSIQLWIGMELRFFEGNSAGQEFDSTCFFLSCP
jgi:hypothetical protein